MFELTRYAVGAAIAGLGVADPRSVAAALRLAAHLARGRRGAV